MSTVSPRHLRAISSTKSSDVARALGMSPGSLRILESTPVAAWTIAQLRAYVEACRCRLELAAEDPLDGDRKTIDLA